MKKETKRECLAEQHVGCIKTVLIDCDLLVKSWTGALHLDTCGLCSWNPCKLHNGETVMGRSHGS